MPQTKQRLVSIRFQEFELDLHSGELRRSGAPVVRIPEQSFQILKILLERPGDVVSRAAIQQLLWPDGTIVEFEHSIGAAMNRLRQALGDSAENPRFVETLPRRGYRWIGGAEWVSESESDSSSAPEPSRVSTPPGAPRFKVVLWAVVASTVTLVLGLAVVWSVYSHRQHHLTGRDTIVVADFTNTTGDPVFDDTLRQGLRVQLEQSPFLNVLSDQKVNDQLKLMMQPAGQNLTSELAREVCQRSGSTAVVKGSVARLGNEYVLGLSASNCGDGEELDNEQVTAQTREQVLQALGTAARSMRLKLGESLATVQKFDSPLEQATTPNLEALKAYSLGLLKLGKGDASDSIPLFEKAIELDSGFAEAYLQLGHSYSFLAKYALGREQTRKAYELRQRASERERFDIVAAYHQSVSFDLQRTIENCALWEQSYPRDFVPHRILGFENAVLGKYERSAEEFAKAIDLDPEQSIPYAGLMDDYMALDRLADVEAVYKDAKAHHTASAMLDSNMYLLAFLRRDTREMAKVSAMLLAEPGFEITALRQQADTAGYFGHFTAARQSTAQMKEIALRDKDTAVAADFLSDAAFRESLVGNMDESRRYAAEAAKLGGEPPTALMLSSDPATATRMVDLLDSNSPPDGVMHNVRLPMIRGAIELKRGNAARALELFALALPYESGWFDNYLPAYLRGEAYLLAHRGQEAAAEFQKVVSHRGVVLNSEIGAVAYVGLARAYAMQGEKAKAKAAYQEFLTLWKDAEVNTPILKQAKDEYAKLQ